MEWGFAISKSRELLFYRDLEIAKPNSSPHYRTIVFIYFIQLSYRRSDIHLTMY